MLTEGVSLIDSRSDRVVMEPNPTYWNPARRPTVRIVYDNVIGKAEGIKSVASGDGRVDVVFDLTPDEACVSACNFDPLRWGIGIQF